MASLISIRLATSNRINFSLGKYLVLAILALAD